MSVDTDSRKISLGHKQINDNPWDNFEKEYAIGRTTEGKVVRVIEKGIITELPLGVDGFVPSTQLSTSKIKNLSFCYPIEIKLPLKIVEFDKENKKIVLSALAVLKDKSNDDIMNYIKTYKLEKVSVDDIKNADSAKFDSSDFNLYEDEKKDKGEPQSAPETEKKDEN